jgi:hypothetical protein
MKKLLTLTIALCLALAMNAQQSQWHKRLQVNPKPTVSMAVDPIVCENENITITFTGIIDANGTFTLNYKIDVANCPTVALNGTGLAPSVIGLPTVFSLSPATGQGQLTLTAGSLDPVTKASTYTATISAGSAGDFMFHLLSVADDNCSNAATQDVSVTVQPMPTVIVTELFKDICLGAGVEFTSNYDNTVLNFTTNSNNDELDGTFNFGIPNADTPETQLSAAIGTFDFTLNSITANGCTWTSGIGIYNGKEDTANVTSYSTTVHALPTAEIVEVGPICQNSTFTLAFHGTPDFNLASLNVVGGGFTKPAILPEGYLTAGTAPADLAGDKDWTFVITSVSAGAITATGTIKDVWGCVSESISDAITVVPTPTVTFPEIDELCQDGTITLAFTGSDPAFTMDYRLTIDPSTTMVEPSTIGLTKNITATQVTAPSDVNGTYTVGTYTAEIIAGKAGIFDFYLKSLTNNGCTITNTDTANEGYGTLVTP